MRNGATRPVRLAVGGLVSLAVAMGIGRFAYTPILPFMIDALGLSQAQAGAIASANFVGYLVGAVAAATRLIAGARAWLIGSLVASAVTSGAMAAASSFAMLVALRFLGGVASAFVLILASSLVLGRLARAGRDELGGLLFAGVGTGIALSAVLVSAAAALCLSWRLMWAACGLASLAGTGVVAATVPPADSSHAEHRGRAGFAVDARLAALILSYGLVGFGYVISATFLVAIVRGAPALRPLEPFVWLAVGLSAVPSAWLWGAATDRIGLFRAYAVACLVEAGGIAAGLPGTGVVGLAVAAVTLGGTFIGITALGLRGARNLSLSDPRRGVAVMTAAFGVGQVAGPLFAGVVHDLTGSFVAPLTTAAVLLAAAAALALRAGRPP
jgi:predicted MFS family arabinose efflux permease